MRMIVNMVAGAATCVIMPYYSMVVAFGLDMKDSLVLLPYTAVFGLVFGAIVSVLKNKEGEYRWDLRQSVLRSVAFPLSIMVIIATLFPFLIIALSYFSNF